MPHPGKLKASKKILSAERPVIYAGGGVILGNAHKELIALNKLLKAPLTNTLMGLEHILQKINILWGCWNARYLPANMAMHNVDVIIAIGARFDDRITNTPSMFAPNAKIIHIDVDPASISKIINADIPIVGQVKESLIALIKEIKRSKIKIDSEALDQWICKFLSGVKNMAWIMTYI